MKPVNLNPGSTPVIKEPSAAPSMGMVGGAIAGVVAIVGVAGFFAMARIDTLKEETAQAQTSAQQATSETAAVHSRVQSLGSPVQDSDKQLEQGAEQVLVGAYTQRRDFVMLAQELQGIMDPSGWYESVKVDTTGAPGSGDTTSEVRIVGYMPDEKLLASFDDRVNGTQTLDNAETVDIKSVTLRDPDNGKPGVYWRFELTADMVDTVAPYATSASTGGSDDGVKVGNSSAKPLTLSLDPKPKAATPKSSAPAAVAAPPKPKNPFDIAATVASRGGTG
jgi:hypothetical protein